MNRLLIALMMCITWASAAFGQTTVNLSVTDTPDNQTWNNGTWSVQLIPGPGNLDQTRNFTLLVAGGSLGSQSGSLSSTGTASMALPANANIGPVGTKWQFTVCSQQGTACAISNVTVTTSSPQTVALTPPSIRVSASPNLPPIVVYTTTEVPFASLGAQITVVGSTPSTPAIQACTVVSGSTCTTWTGIGGGGVSGSYGPLAFSCTNCNPNVQYAFAVTCNNTSQTITTGTNDPPFVAADVGKIIAGSAAGNAAANCPPQGTITAFGGAHSVTVSVAATATTTTGALAWGTQDDGPNLRNAFLASLGKGCLYLPVGSMFAGAPGSDSTNLFVDTRPPTATGFPTCVIGQANTIITPLPTFNYANCLASDACFSRFSPFTNAQPQYGYLSNVELLLVGYNLTGTGTNLGWINWHNNTMQNVWLWCPTFDFFQISNGFFGAGPTAVFYINTFFAANNGMNATGTGGTSAGLNQLITINQGYSQSHQSSLVVGANAGLKTVGLQYGTPNNGPTITSSGVWDSWGEGVFHGFGTADSVRVNGGTTSLHGTWVVGASGNTLGALNCNTSGATIMLDGGAVDGGGGGGLALKSVAGCTIKARFPVQALNYAASLSGNNVSDPSETQTGACTTNAATVTFKLTYAVAPLVLVSDTTSASTGAQATSTNTTTATIHCNGASDTFTATVIPNPI